jgi:predicted DNA-binding protein with PD1-like motif
MFLVSVQPGQEVIDAVTRELRSRQVIQGAIISLIGAVDSACISNMPRDDAKSDILSEYEQPMEMSGTGEITDGRPHIHAVLGVEGNGSLAGHLHWARVRTHFVNVYIEPA